MNLDDKARVFLETNHSAAMTTLRRDGSPHTVRVGVCLVGGKIWSSGTQDRARTKHLRRDPRCALFVFDPAYSYLVCDATVTILDGPDSPAMSVKLFRVMQGRPEGPLQWFGGDVSEDEFIQKMVSEQRLIYEFDPIRVSGLY